MTAFSVNRVRREGGADKDWVMTKLIGVQANTNQRLVQSQGHLLIRVRRHEAHDVVEQDQDILLRMDAHGGSFSPQLGHCGVCISQRL